MDGYSCLKYSFVVSCKCPVCPAVNNNHLRNKYIVCIHICIIIWRLQEAQLLITSLNHQLMIMSRESLLSTATTANITCALSITIRDHILVTWTHNGTSFISPNDILRSGNAITLLIRDLQPSDLGVYECAFTDSNNGWRLRRTITLG